MHLGRNTARLRTVLALTLVVAFIIGALGFRLSAATAAVPVPSKAVDAPLVSSIVISQVYGGGGNSGAFYTHDFIELFNRSASSVSIAGWSVQYASATGNTWAVTVLSGTIPAGSYYLVQEAQGSGGTQPLPTPDAIGTIAMSGTAGKVALVSNSTALTGACPAGGALVELVGFGTTANCFEGSGPAPAFPNNNTSDVRLDGGCTDTDNNSTDFVNVSPPTPRNSQSPLNVCGAQVTTTPSGTATSTATGTPPTATSTTTSTPIPTPGSIRIHDIQGAAHLSPLNGNSVVNVPGIVIAKVSNGFYLQDPLPDTNNATSEGILVFTSSAPTVNVGDSLLVSGSVTEFRAGGASSSNLTTTEISAPVVTIVSTGNPLPAPVIIGTGGRIPPNMVYDDDATCGNVELCGTFDADTDGIDYWESLESMRTQVNNAVVVGPTAQFTGGLPNREVYVVGDNGANANVRTTRGGLVIRPNDLNPERIVVSNQFVTIPDMSVSDTFAGPIVGVISYNFGKFLLNATNPVVAVPANLPKEITTSPAPNELTIGNFNVENLSPNDPASKFTNLANLIVTNMKSPDVISIQEIQDNNGTTNNGVVDANVTWDMLIAAIQGVGGPTYTYRQINPVNNDDGGAPGGNIRQGFLFRTDTGLTFVDRPGGGPLTATQVLTGSGAPYLQFSPGRLDPTNTAFDNSRKPLAGEFMYNGRKVFLIANHFNSKGGDEPLFSKNQPPILSSEAQRIQQAQVVATTVSQILNYDPNALIGVVGDLNDFEFSPPLTVLRNVGLFPMIETLPVPERYSYVFVGNSQSLDHEMVSPALLVAATGYDAIHVNAEYTPQDSDHDPEVGRYLLPVGATSTPVATQTATRTSTVTSVPTGTSTTTGTSTGTSTITVTRTGTASATLTATSTGTAVVSATATGCVPGQALLLVPDWTGDRVMAFDPFNGNLVNADYIPTDATHLASPKNAILSSAGNTILVSDQIRDAVQEFSLSGTWIRTFAPAGGPDPNILDNIRGITLKPNGNLLVAVGGGPNTNAIAEFDTNGNYLGNFIAAGAGGLSSPFDVTYRGIDYLVTSSAGASMGALRYDPVTGAFLGQFAPISGFPQQITVVSNTNVLAAAFNGTQTGVLEYTAAGTLLDRYSVVTGNRGTHELGNGNILTTDGDGVYEITRANTVVSVEMAGVNAQYIEYVVVGGTCGTPTGTATSVVSATTTSTRTNTAVATATATSTNTSTTAPSNTITVTRTSTSTSVPPTLTSTNTSTTVPSTSTSTSTQVATGTSTGTGTAVVTSTASATGTTAVSATATSTSVVSATASSTGTAVVTSTASVPVPSETATSGTPTASPTVCVLQFTDVPEGSTFYENIRCLACRGIINGYTTGCSTGAPCFRPANPTTRGQISKIVANTANFTEPAGAQQYEDVLPGSTFYDYIWRLTERGIVNGYPCGGAGEPCGATSMPYFRPNVNVTRGQISKIVAEAAGLTEPAGAQQYEDVLPGSTFYDYIWRLSILDVMRGYPCGGVGEPCGDPELPYFRPNVNATRGQTSKIVANTFLPDCETP